MDRSLFGEIGKFFFGKTHLLSVMRGLPLLTALVLAQPVVAQVQEEVTPPGTLKKLSVEELMDVEVTSITMRPEKLAEVASAVQVITAREIQRSAATRLPEALRLASNLQVSQANSHDWAITARGFNGLPSAGGVLANKLLVMIDGRSIYNPLLGGVYWDVQNVLLEDLQRIEVVSGPGGTIWGANAVNGVINIISKSAKETQGIFASATQGSFLDDHAQIRYGFQAAKNLFFRVYGQRFDQRHTVLANEKSAKDQWNMNQGGFRMDYLPSSSDILTIQGDVYSGTLNDSVRRADTDGQNLIAKYSHAFTEESSLVAQVFFDRTWRKSPRAVNRSFYQLYTYDVDLQYRFPARRRHSLLVGGAYRFQRDKLPRGLNPLSRGMALYSGFIQDEIALGEKMRLTIGSKFLDNIFSGFEIQPSARIAWMPDRKQTVWAAASRAVRIPTRFDSDITASEKRFDSEKVTAFEAGYRVQPLERVSISLATFFNKYDELRSLDSAESPSPPVILANSQRAESWGLEFSGAFQPLDNWRLRAGYTFFQKNIWHRHAKIHPLSEDFEGVDPENQMMLQSMLDVKAFQFDVVCRFVESLPPVSTSVRGVPSYFTFDARIAWTMGFIELSLVGQNLLEDKHKETGSSLIPRTIYGKLTWRWQK